MGKDDQYLDHFASRIKDLILERWPSYRQAAKDLDIPPSTLTNFAKGKNEPSAGLLLALSTKLNASLSYILGLDDDPRPPPPRGMARKAEIDMVFLSNLDARAAAGAGAANHIVAIERFLPFPVWMLHKFAPPGAKLTVLRAHGDSMEPTFASGALLVVNNDDTAPPAKPPKGRDADIFVFSVDGEDHVKRLRRKGDSLLAISDNRAYDPEVFSKANLKRVKIIGRVVWWDNRL